MQDVLLYQSSPFFLTPREKSWSIEKINGKVKVTSTNGFATFWFSSMKDVPDQILHGYAVEVK